MILQSRTFIKFDDVKQDHRIISHYETSRNRSSGYCIIVVIEPKHLHRSETQVVVGSLSGKVNNGHGPTSAYNNWINHISFLSPISLENNTWYHIALVRKMLRIGHFI